MMAGTKVPAIAHRLQEMNMRASSRAKTYTKLTSALLRWMVTSDHNGRGISPRSQNSPAIKRSASSVTGSRMCSSGACCEQPG
jgi:hypothetical protein